MTGRLAGQAAVVTGGASGLGLAIVERFVEEGAGVVAFDRSADRLAALEAAHSGRVRSAVGDVRSAGDNARAVALCVEAFGAIDCAVANAGLWDFNATLDSLDACGIDAAFDEIFQVNVKGGLHLAKAALPSLVRSGGSMVFTVSNAGSDPGGGGPLYTASKHAVVGLIRQLAFEWAPAVRVNGVAPGPIATDLRGPDALDMADRSIGSIDLARVAAPSVPLNLVPQPADYAGAYVMLASRRDNRASTGSVVSLDTGIAVRGVGRTSLGGKLVEKYA